MAIVYKHTNRFNGKCYIGVTTRTIEERWVEHVSKRYRMSTYFAFALREFDESWWEHEILFDGDESVCYEKELYYIKMFGSNTVGYNTTEGGKSPRIPTSVKRKRTGSNNYQFKGYYITPLGRFETQHEAAIVHGCESHKIGKRCIHENDRILTKKAIVKAEDLDDSMIGKTFNDIGWRFEDAGNTSTWND